tara:strand:+ start:4376 stop:4783 length:408 start_codon:yes stop_codon:yes gene_type:complete
MSDNKQPNWDKITEGKIRHGFAVEAFSKDRKLDGDLMKEIDRWVYFVVHGYHDLKEVLKNGKMSSEEVKDAIIEKFDGEVIKQTDEEYIKEQIEKNIVGLKKQDQNKILYQLKNGTITLDNLQACLDKIEVMQSR